MRIPIPGKSVWISVGIVLGVYLLALNYGRKYDLTKNVTNTVRGHLGLA